MLDTIFLRFFAILLIVNSHADSLYPIPFLATGGAIGNSLFFMLSGYGLYLSEQKRSKGFSEWYSARISRIYPSVWVFLVLFDLPLRFFSGNLHFKDMTRVLVDFLAPPFWFLQALIIFYFLIYLVIHRYSAKKMFLAVLATSILYIYTYGWLIDLNRFVIEDLPFKIIFYFAICLLGIELGRRASSITPGGWGSLTMLVVLIAIMYAHKFCMAQNIASNLQFVQQAALIPMMYYFLKVAKSAWVSTLLTKIPTLERFVRAVSDMTLEIYIVHMIILVFVAKWQLAFPLNVFVFLGLTLTLAFVTKYCVRRIFFENPFFKVA